MARKSVRENKNMYQLAREEAGFTRAQASEISGDLLSDSQIEKIESERKQPYPEEVLTMARIYKNPGLCNVYCSQVCAIGQEYVPHVEVKDLSHIAMEVLLSVNRLAREKERLVEISVDDKITDDELEDFARIRNELNSISMTVTALQLWVDKMLASGNIDKEKLDQY